MIFPHKPRSFVSAALEWLFAILGLGGLLAFYFVLLLALLAIFA